MYFYQKSKPDKFRTHCIVLGATAAPTDPGDERERDSVAALADGFSHVSVASLSSRTSRCSLRAPSRR